MSPLARIFSAFLAVLSVHLYGAGARNADDRPNILFIITDDQSYDALSIVQKDQGSTGRFPWLKTPNLDRLATEGVRFRNAFVVNSLCSPSRAVNLTGRYNHLNGIASNFRPFPPSSVTHATLLRGAGYTTGYVGKWHMGSQRERPGFDYHATYIGHGLYDNAPFLVDGATTATQGWVDDVATDFAIRFINEQKVSAKPWSLILGFKTPHQPWQPPSRTKDLYAGEVARTVPNFNTPPPYLSDRRTKRSGQPVPPTAATNLDYFRCITAMDDCIGRVLGALEESGCADNTIVIFTSDNGFYLGAHATGDKRSAYDESLRVPFIVRYPALRDAGRGRVVDEMVLNLDLAPSLLDFARVPVPPEMQGQSWRPLLEGEPTAWRQSWFFEYFAENQKSSQVPDITGVRTIDAKLIRYRGHPDWNELFDLKADPYEVKNLYHDPAAAALKTSMAREHDRLAVEVAYVVPDFVDRPQNWGQPGSLAGEDLPAAPTAPDSP